MSNFTPIDGMGRPIPPTPNARTATSAEAADRGSARPYTATSQRAEGPVTPVTWNAIDSLQGAPTAHMDPSGDAPPAPAPTADSSSAEPRTAKPKATLRSLAARLDALEAKASGPFGTVRSALQTVEASRANLTAELEGRYQQSVEWMHQMVENPRGWQAGLQDEVGRYCDERNAGLRESGRGVSDRLEALEGWRREGGEGGREGCEERIGAVLKAVERLDACTTDGFQQADDECRQRYDKNVETVGAVSARVAELSSSVDGVTGQLEGHQKRLSDVEAAAADAASSQVRAQHDYCSNEDLKNALRRTLEMMDQQRGRRNELEGSIQRVEERLDELDAAARSGPQQTDGAKPNNSHATEVAAGIHDLRARVTNIEHTSLSAALDNRFSAISERMSKMEASSSICTRRVEARTGNLNTRLANIEEKTSDEALKQRVDASFASHVATLSKMSARVGSLEGAAEVAGSRTEQSMQRLRQQLATLEESSVATAVDRRFEILAERVDKLQEGVASGATERRLDGLIDRFDSLQRDAMRTEEARSQQREELTKRAGRLEEDLQDVKTAQEVGRSGFEELRRKLDDFASDLKEKDGAFARASRETACLTAAHHELEKRLGELKEASDLMRDCYQRGSDDRKADDQANAERMQARDTQLDLRLDCFEAKVDGWKEEVAASIAAGGRTKEQQQQQQPEDRTDLATDIRRLRHRIEESGVDAKARRQLSELCRLMFDGSLSPTGKRASGGEYDDQAPQQDATTLNGLETQPSAVNAALSNKPGDDEPLNQPPRLETSPARARQRHGSPATPSAHPITHPSTKRRRVDGGSNGRSFSRSRGRTSQAHVQLLRST